MNILEVSDFNLGFVFTTFDYIVLTILFLFALFLLKLRVKKITKIKIDKFFAKYDINMAEDDDDEVLVKLHNIANPKNRKTKKINRKIAEKLIIWYSGADFKWNDD